MIVPPSARAAEPKGPGPHTGDEVDAGRVRRAVRLYRAPVAAADDGPNSGWGVVATTGVTAVGGPRRLERRALVRHYLEMVVAMLLGMAVLGGVVSAAFAALGRSELLDRVSIRGPIMATTMSIGMALWMRHRRHRWAVVAEMAGAMYVPLVVLLVPFWLGMLPDGAVLGPMHLLMLPAMALAMLRRRDEYTHHHPGRPPGHVPE